MTAWMVRMRIGTCGGLAALAALAGNGYAGADLHISDLEPEAQAPRLSQIGRYDSGLGEGAAEISAFDAGSRRLFVINAASATVDIVDLTDPAAPAPVGQLDIGELFSAGDVQASPNSVATHAGLVAVAVQRDEADNTQHPGLLAFFNTEGTLLDTAPAGALPDMVTFTPDGRRVLAANEGEPNQDYTFDPEGSVTIVRVDHLYKGKRLPRGHVKQVGFAAFNAQADALRAAGVRVYGPNATVAQDLEPEYIAVAPDGRRAYVTLQENNALAIIDVNEGTVLGVQPLGYKDWTQSGLDASDRDNAINIMPWPVLGMYQPDGVAAYVADGLVRLVTANEGDARDYEAFAEEARVSALSLDTNAFPNAATLRQNAKLGRLTVTRTLGNADGDGDYEALYTLGGRSFSIWTVGQNGVLTPTYDSADELEQVTAAALPARFNGNPFDTRSDNKGPEPEGVAVGAYAGRTYAFVALERIGGVVVYDVTAPAAPSFVQYLNTSDVVAGEVVGDVAPEGVEFVAANESPTGQPLVIVAHEVSGTVAIFELR